MNGGEGGEKEWVETGGRAQARDGVTKRDGEESDRECSRDPLKVTIKVSALL